MINKINSIDVSECRFYEPKAQKMTCHEEAITKPCENTPICYYKLLQKSYIEIQRLQKENEKLKNKNNDLIEEIASGNIDIAILQKENEKLKADLKGETEQCQKWYQLETDKHFQMLKYEQALEKIRKEYTNSIFYQCDKTEEECPCHNCIILGQLDRVQNIVKIIDEVLNDRD